MRKTKIKLLEVLIYALLWILVFTMPLFFSHVPEGSTFCKLTHDWIVILTYFIIFLINNFLLFKIFQKRKYLIYLTVSFAFVIASSYFFFHSTRYISELFHINLEPPSLHHARITNPQSYLRTQYFNRIVIGMLIIGMNDAIKIFFLWFKHQREIEQAKQESLKNELALLRQQISPHFFMNTLNNIHALIDINKDVAKESVVKLSTLMRALLYDNVEEKIPLRQELEFLNDYIDLMRIRLNDRVKIEYNCDIYLPKIRIYPLIFINFVENAFKHGILPEKESFIKVNFYTEDNYICMRVINTYDENEVKKSKGLGVENAIKRLDIIYGDAYIYKVNCKNSIYDVLLQLPILYSKLQTSSPHLKREEKTEDIEY